MRPGGTFDGNALNIKSATGKRARRGGTGGGSDEKATEEGRRRGLLFFSFFPFVSRLVSPCLVLHRARGATRLPCPPLAPLFSPSARPLSPPCSLAAQAGAVSQHKSLGINKGGDSAPALDHQSLGVAHAMSAPKPPSTVNAVDKTTVSLRLGRWGETKHKGNITKRRSLPRSRPSPFPPPSSPRSLCATTPAASKRPVGPVRRHPFLKNTLLRLL